MISTLDLPARLDAAAEILELRRATPDDLAALMGLLADDPISAARGDTLDDADAAAYGTALAAIVAEPSNELLLVVDAAGRPAATMQLTRIPGMARRGSSRLLVEAVRVSGDRRSGGIGSAMMRWVTETAAPAVGASIVQLTSDEARTDAHRFYERLGFASSHRGFTYRVD